MHPMATGNGKPKKQWNHFDWLVELLQNAGNVDYDGGYAQAMVLLAHPEFFLNSAAEQGIATVSEAGTEEHEVDS